MWLQILRMILVISFVLGSYYLIHFILGKGIKINRWLCGIGAFVIVLIPKLIFPNMNLFFSIILYLLCGVLSIAFFEVTRLKLEEQGKRGR